MRTVFRLIILAYLFAIPVVTASSYRLLYREQLYELSHRQFTQTPERVAENIYWLEQALRSDFANPLNALAVIENEREWEWYRALFTMHINLRLVDLYLQWGALYMKRDAYFYNAPWRDENLESLQRAEDFFRYAQRYWEAAQRWSQEVADVQFINLEEIQRWEDEHYRIRTGDLDYDTLIARHLDRVAEVRAAFSAMNNRY